MEATGSEFDLITWKWLSYLQFCWQQRCIPLQLFH